MSRYLNVAVFNAAGGSNRSGQQHFVNWYDDLFDNGADVALVSEVFRFARVLRGCGHLSVGTSGHGREDVGVITRRKPIRSKQVQVTEFVERPHSDKPLLWHDRWVTRTVVGRLPGRKVVAVSGHAPAVIQDQRKGRLFDNDGAREWLAHGLPLTEALLRRDMHRSRPLIHGWDANQRPGDGQENPAAMYRRLGMRWANDDVMWFAFNPRRFALVSQEWITTPPGSDGHRTGLFVLRRR